MFDLFYEHPFYLVAVTATLMLFLLNRETYKIIKHNKKEKERKKKKHEKECTKTNI